MFFAVSDTFPRPLRRLIGVVRLDGYAEWSPYLCHLARVPSSQVSGRGGLMCLRVDNSLLTSDVGFVKRRLTQGVTDVS